MVKENIYELIKFDELSVTPKYLQITGAILKAIEEKKLSKGYFLPSLNELSLEMDISRSTAERVYSHLKKIGIISSFPGKGYYISNTDIKQPLRIFLLFNKLSIHKQIIYDAFVKALGENAIVDFYVYNNDFAIFRKILTEIKEQYSYYVIIPHFMEGAEKAADIINTIPKEKLIILDKRIPGVKGTYGAVYEKFEEDIYGALLQANDRLSRYQSLAIIFPDYTYHPQEIIQGFRNFCLDYAYKYAIIHDIENEVIQEGTIYISLMEADLVPLIKKIKAAGKEVGKDVGVISYNEVPLKEIILSGITTISSDFKKMGELAAQLIVTRSTEQIAAPFYLTLRPSL